jgi:hypothetical protein
MSELVRCYPACDCRFGKGGNNCKGGGIVVWIVSTRRSTASWLCLLLLLHIGSAVAAPAVASDKGKHGGKRGNTDYSGALSAFMKDMTKQFAYILHGLNKVYVMAGARSGRSTVIRGGVVLALGGGEGGCGKIVTSHDDCDNDVCIN